MNQKVDMVAHAVRAATAPNATLTQWQQRESIIN